jgi:hypothetical protein
MICETLIKKGWKECPNQFKKCARCFYKQFETPTSCHCNNDKTGIQVEISVVESAVVEFAGSCELELVGELADGTWMRLHNHGLPADINSVLALIPRMLMVWEASNKGALELMVERGAKAWKDVPDASAWVEELRGNDAP